MKTFDRGPGLLERGGDVQRAQGQVVDASLAVGEAQVEHVEVHDRDVRRVAPHHSSSSDSGSISGKDPSKYLPIMVRVRWTRFPRSLARSELTL